MRRFLFLSLCLFLFGCSEPKIDKETPEESVAELKSSLSSEELQEFEEALNTVTVNAASDAMQQAFTDDLDPDAVAEDFVEKLDGMTADDVISYADSIERAKVQEERRQALQEIEELRKKRKTVKKAEASLSQFEVDRSRFYKRERRFGTDQPVIELTVENNTEHAVSRAYFESELRSPDREVPWLEESFNYEISGGIEPGERQTWELAPNMFSDWGDVEERSDMVLIVEPYRLDGPDGEPLFEADWDQSDEERLNTLVDEYGEYLDE